MKKLFALLSLALCLTFGVTNLVFAQDQVDSTTTEQADSAQTDVVTQENTAATQVEQSKSFHQVIKQKFIEGGASFMGIVLLCLILGLALGIERIIYLNKATTNTAN